MISAYVLQLQPKSGMIISQGQAIVKDVSVLYETTSELQRAIANISATGAFITSKSDTATITITVVAGNLSAAFTSLLISQFTNDAGYITSSGITPAAMTKADDVNVTLTLGGTPLTSLLQPVSLTLGWTGTLADIRIASAATWNAKESALTFSSPFVRVGNVISVPVATGSGSGYLSSTDWTIFNNKAPTASPTFTGTVTVPTPVNGTDAVNKNYSDLKMFALANSSDQAITSTVGVAITNLSFTPEASKNYRVRWMVPVTTSSTNGLKISVTLPTGATCVLTVVAQAATAFAAPQTLTTSGVFGATIFTATTTAGYFYVEGTIFNGANATQIDLVVATLNAANTVTAKNGSGGFVEKVN
jgi:hypothetical protein